jgi:hypothetical protein
MKLCHNVVAIIISAIIISALIKSGKADVSLLISPSPTQAPATTSPTKAGFSLVGTGSCRDSKNDWYDFAKLDNQTNDINAAINWCKTATAYVSSLVGVEIGNGSWFCRYNNGIVDNIQNTDFSPTASDKGNGLVGIGAVNSADGSSGYTCYKHEVRRIDSSCIIYFLSSLTALLNSLVFRILE